MLSQVLDAVRNPLHVLLDRGRHIAQDRRAAWTRDREEIRKARNLKSQIALGALGPLLLELTAAPAANIHSDQRARHRVEASREDDDIELVIRPVLGSNSRRRDLDNRSRAYVDEGDILTVERLEVVRVDREPLRSERMTSRNQLLRGLGVLHGLADLRACEVGDRLVRLLVVQEVTERVEDEAKAAGLPAGLEGGLPLLFRDLECGDFTR